MARFHATDHAQRALTLLMGMRLPRVQAALLPYGWDASVLREGWERLSQLSVDVGVADVVPEATAVLTRRLEEFESRWFPVCVAALSARFPKHARKLFAGLSHARGPEAIVAVEIFLERLCALEAGRAPFGSEGRVAFTLLERRGLSRAVLADAGDVLEELKSVASGGIPPLDQEREREALATLAVWVSEWSSICRVAISDKTLLRALGLRKTATPPRAGRISPHELRGHGGFALPQSKQMNRSHHGKVSLEYTDEARPALHDGRKRE